MPTQNALPARSAADAAGYKPVRRTDFERNFASETAVPRAIHFAHPASPERGQYFVRAEPCARE